MPDRAKTLVLEADGYGWQRILADTTLHWLFNKKETEGIKRQMQKTRLAKWSREVAGGVHNSDSF